jgi:hypothetical protein
MASPYKTLKTSGWQFPKPHESTIPELFIIESMHDKDEESGFFEGVRLAQILRLAGRKPKYFYVQDERELELLIPVFRQANYRYLHFSCHGDNLGFDLTNGSISFDTFAAIFEDALNVRRLFVSSCEAGQESLVHALHKTTRGIQSVTAPSVKIDYDHAAAIWAAFYLSLLEKPEEACTHWDITSRLSLLMKLFPHSNVANKDPMSFMFAGYAPNLEGGKPPNPKAWVFETIDQHYIPKPPPKKKSKSARD